MHALLQHIHTNPNQSRNSDGATPLFMASCSGHEAVVHALLQHSHTNPNQPRTVDGATPLFAASAKGHHNIVCALLEKKADANQPCHDGMTPLMTAASCGFGDVVHTLLLNCPPQHTNTDNVVWALRFAIENRHKEVVSQLVCGGVCSVPPMVHGHYSKVIWWTNGLGELDC